MVSRALLNYILANDWLTRVRTIPNAHSGGMVGGVRGKMVGKWPG